MTPPLPASLLDADLIPWLVALDYGDTDVMRCAPAWEILAPHYADKAAAVRALVAATTRVAVPLARKDEMVDATLRIRGWSYTPKQIAALTVERFGRAEA